MKSYVGYKIVNESQIQFNLAQEIEKNNHFLNFRHICNSEFEISLGYGNK